MDIPATLQNELDSITGYNAATGTSLMQQEIASPGSTGTSPITGVSAQLQSVLDNANSGVTGSNTSNSAGTTTSGSGLINSYCGSPVNSTLPLGLGWLLNNTAGSLQSGVCNLLGQPVQAPATSAATSQSTWFASWIGRVLCIILGILLIIAGLRALGGEEATESISAAIKGAGKSIANPMAP